MWGVLRGVVGLFEVPQAGDDEDDEDDEDPSVNGVVETRPLGVPGWRLVRLFEVPRAILHSNSELFPVLG